MSATHTIKVQAPRCYGKSRGHCAVCHRATRADELLWFLFCPSCYALICSEIEAALAHEEAPEAASRIESETILLPCVIADRVVQELSRFLGADLDTGDHELANKLVVRAERIYEANPRFRRSMKQRGGRDDLYMWMRHWLSGEVSDCRPDLSRRIPDDFKRGLEIRPANTGQEKEARATGNGCTGMGPVQGGRIPHKTTTVTLR